MLAKGQADQQWLRSLVGRGSQDQRSDRVHGARPQKKPQACKPPDIRISSTSLPCTCSICSLAAQSRIPHGSRRLRVIPRDVTLTLEAVCRHSLSSSYRILPWSQRLVYSPSNAAYVECPQSRSLRAKTHLLNSRRAGREGRQPSAFPCAARRYPRPEGGWRVQRVIRTSTLVLYTGVASSTDIGGTLC